MIKKLSNTCNYINCHSNYRKLRTALWLVGFVWVLLSALLERWWIRKAEGWGRSECLSYIALKPTELAISINMVFFCKKHLESHSFPRFPSQDRKQIHPHMPLYFSFFGFLLCMYIIICSCCHGDAGLELWDGCNHFPEPETRCPAPLHQLSCDCQSFTFCELRYSWTYLFLARGFSHIYYRMKNIVSRILKFK